MDSQAVGQEGTEEDALAVAKWSACNRMDPCLRFPYDDVQELFDGATMIEGMLVALEHRHIYFVSCSSSRLNDVQWNVVSLPQDSSAFVACRGSGPVYRAGDRVNSTRGPGWDLERRPLKACEVDASRKAGHAVTSGGDLVYPARVREVMLDGALLLDYDHGGEGLELVQWVWARAQMPWHPKCVPLVLNLHRNLGRGVVLEGMQVRWWYVSRLLRALCAYAPSGRVWRKGGREQDPMHKFYDPRMIDVLDESAMRSRFDRTTDLAELPAELKTGEDFSMAGFRVNVAEPEIGDGFTRQVWLEEKIFSAWLQLGNLQLSGAVASWWTGLYSTETSGHCEENALKSAGENTCVEFFQRLCECVKAFDAEDVRHGAIRLDALQRWLENELGEEVLGIERGQRMLEQLELEMGVVQELELGVRDCGGIEEAVDRADEDEQLKSLADRLVYGWPNKAADLVTVRDAGSFVKAFRNVRRRIDSDALGDVSRLDKQVVLLIELPLTRALAFAVNFFNRVYLSSGLPENLATTRDLGTKLLSDCCDFQESITALLEAGANWSYIYEAMHGQKWDLEWRQWVHAFHIDFHPMSASDCRHLACVKVEDLLGVGR